MSDIVLNENIANEFFKFYFQISDYNILVVRRLILNFKPFIINRSYINKLIDMLPEAKKNDKRYQKNIIDRFKSNNQFWELHDEDDIKSRVLDSKYRILLIDNTDVNNHSDYKIINIEQNNSVFPYKETILHSKSRRAIQSYIKNLLINSKLITIKDRYAYKMHSDINAFFNNCRAQIKIYTDRKNQYTLPRNSKISLHNYQSKKMHDRYIEITYKNDSKITILLSSGLEYLFSTNKELTIVVY